MQHASHFALSVASHATPKNAQKEKTKKREQGKHERQCLSGASVDALSTILARLAFFRMSVHRVEHGSTMPAVAQVEWFFLPVAFGPTIRDFSKKKIMASCSLPFDPLTCQAPHSASSGNASQTK